MSPRDKAHFYHSLAQLLRAGITFPRALEKLGSTSGGIATRIRRGLDRGLTVAEACVAADIGGTEAAVLTAVERAGYLDRGLEELARHFTAVATARGKVLAKLAYPAFILVLGVLLLNLPVLVRSDFDAYLRATVPLLAGAAVGVALSLAIAKMLAALGVVSAFVDALLRAIPLVGGTRRAFAMSRFCTAYELQLGAGINAIDALAAAGMASRSGLVRSAVARALPQVRAGSQVGPLLAEGGAFDPEVAEGIIVAEESGTQSTSLRRLAEAQSERAHARLDALAEWLPRLLYVFVLGYVGWQIVRVYRDYLGQLQPLLEGL